MWSCNNNVWYSTCYSNIYNIMCVYTFCYEYHVWYNFCGWTRWRRWWLWNSGEYSNGVLTTLVIIWVMVNDNIYLFIVLIIIFSTLPTTVDHVKPTPIIITSTVSIWNQHDIIFHSIPVNTSPLQSYTHCLYQVRFLCNSTFITYCTPFTYFSTYIYVCMYVCM